VREHYNAVWKYIHIDEYQDTNRVQYKIAKLLADSRGADGNIGTSRPGIAGSGLNICVVGDADQNIYSWRGATIENILNFEKDYPEAQVIALEMKLSLDQNHHYRRQQHHRKECRTKKEDFAH